MVKDALNLKEALELGLIKIGQNVLISNEARFIPEEDDGKNYGTIIIGNNSIIRAGSIICSGVEIGENTIIGHETVIRVRASIGNQCVISHLVCLERDSIVGNNVRISALTHITGGCVIGDNVQIGARVVTVNDNEMRWRKGEVLKAAQIKSGARIGSGCTLLGHVCIEKDAFIGAGSVVTRSIPANSLAYGNPAYVQGERPAGDWQAGASKLN